MFVFRPNLSDMFVCLHVCVSVCVLVIIWLVIFWSFGTVISILIEFGKFSTLTSQIFPLPYVFLICNSSNKSIRTFYIVPQLLDAPFHFFKHSLYSLCFSVENSYGHTFEFIDYFLGFKKPTNNSFDDILRLCYYVIHFIYFYFILYYSFISLLKFPTFSCICPFFS